MFCRFCGKNIPDNSKVCAYCGKKLIIEEKTVKYKNSFIHQEKPKTSSKVYIGWIILFSSLLLIPLFYYFNEQSKYIATIDLSDEYVDYYVELNGEYDNYYLIGYPVYNYGYSEYMFDKDNGMINFKNNNIKSDKISAFSKYENYDDVLKVSEILNSVKIEFNKESNLKNGEEIIAKLVYNEKLAEKYHIKVNLGQSKLYYIDEPSNEKQIEKQNVNNSSTNSNTNTTQENKRESIGKVKVLINNLFLRDWASKNAPDSGFVKMGTHDVYALIDSEGYTWIEIENGKYIASKQGEWTDLTLY
ncbi:MAG: zinc ribbon domain-containing protein [Erysipelotrichaceae bacterium]|nr:zinc ribbon domain-containing protein [Erysipelotrichaceae bacterium]